MKIREAIASAVLRVLGFHESAQKWSNDRGRVPGWDRDARFDLTQMDLSEQRRKAKFFEANTELVPAMASVFEQYTVGRSGLPITAASSSDSYNSIANAIFSEWRQFPEINSRRSFGETLSLCAYTWFVQGEVFLLKTFGETGNPRLQVIEPHRVASPLFGEAPERIVDGIIVDRNGRPKKYRVATGEDQHDFRTVGAPAIEHICEPSRSGQLRCGPLFSNVMGHLQDLEQLQRNYMRSSKVSSALAAVFKTRDKKVPTEAALARRFNPTLRTSDNTESVEAREQHVRRVVGAELLAMFPDEAIEFPQQNNPTQQQQAFVEFTMARVCIGAGIPPQLIMPRSLQGTVTRADLDRAASLFRMRSEVMQRVARSIRNWVMQDAHDFDPRFAGVEIPKDWWKCNVQPPRQINVDVGRNAAAMIAEWKAGFRTMESIVSELGDNWEETARQKAREARRMIEIARDEGVSVSTLTDSIEQAVTAKN